MLDEWARSASVRESTSQVRALRICKVEEGLGKTCRPGEQAVHAYGEEELGK